MTTGGTSWDTATPITLPYTSDSAPASGYPLGTERPYYAAWWKITPDAAARLTFDSLASTSSADTVLNIFTGADEASKVLVVTNDDDASSSSGLSKTGFIAQQGVEYHIKLGMWGQGAVDGSSGPTGISYVLTGVATAAPDDLTVLVPPVVTTYPPSNSQNGNGFGPITGVDVSPSGAYVSALMAGLHVVFPSTPDQYPYTPVEWNGIFIGKRVGNELVTLLKKEYYDSSTFTVPRATLPESVIGYYQAMYPHWITDNLLLQHIEVSQNDGTGGNVPQVLNFVLYSVSGDVVTEGVPFEIPDFRDVYGASLGTREIGWVNGRVYLLLSRNLGGYNAEMFLVSFAVSGTTASDFITVSLGVFYTAAIIAWYGDSVLLEVTRHETADVFSEHKFQLFGLDGTPGTSLDVVSNNWLQHQVIAAPNGHVVWRFDTVDGPTQSVRATRMDLDAGVVGDPVLIGTTMSTADASVGQPYIYDAVRVNPQRGVVTWGAFDGFTAKMRAIFLDISDPAALTVVEDYYVLDPATLDLDTVQIRPGSPAYGPDWGVLQMKEDYRNPWGYYWVDPAAVVPVPVPTEVAALLTAELLDSGARYE